MSLHTIEINGGGQPTIVYINQGPQGPQGDVGPAGPSITVDQTIIDGSANAVAGNAVFDALALKAPLASPTFTGIVTAPRITGRCDGLEVLCKAGLAIAAGQVVYVTGASGNNIIIGLARANAEATSSKTIGISESTLANNATGYVITEGLMTVSISAPTANEGDPIWLSPTTAGSMVFGVANKPFAPNHIVYLGVVTRKTGNTVVEIYVKVQNGAELDELSDVLITSPVAGQALMRGATLWENRSLVSADISNATSAATANTLALRDATGGSNFAAVGATTVTASDLIYTTGANATIYTSGSDAFITTAGDFAAIYTSGNNAGIFTSGDFATISTTGDFATIFTTGQYGSISTDGDDAYISTSGLVAYISTEGANAYIQSRSTFKLFNGTYTTTLSHSPTANRAIAFPNTSGTVALVNSAQTFTGLQQFSTRPRSSAALTPANTTELITLADGDSRYGAFYNGVSIPQVSSTNTTPIKVASVILPIGVYQIDSLVASVHGTVGLCTIGLKTSQTARITAFENYGNDNTAHVSSAIASDNFAGASQRSATSGTTFSRRVTGIIEIITASTELSIEYSQATTDATASLTRKRAYITATKLS